MSPEPVSPDDLNTRLTQCFATVFPDEKPEGLSRATMESIDGWDSVNLVVLINVVEEEFGIRFKLDNFSGLTSFAAFREYLHGCAVR